MSLPGPASPRATEPKRAIDFHAELAAELFTAVAEDRQNFVARHREIVEDLASPTGFEPVLPP